RLIAKDDAGVIFRVEEPAQLVAEGLGIKLEVGGRLSSTDESRIAERWTDILASIVQGQEPDELASALMLTDPLDLTIAPQAMTFSGGVSEYIFFREA